MTLYRESKENDTAEFKIKNNILTVKWINWNQEYYFLRHHLINSIAHGVKLEMLLKVFPLKLFMQLFFFI